MKSYPVQFFLMIMFLFSFNAIAQEVDNGTYKVTFRSKGQKIALLSGDVTKLTAIKSFNAVLDKTKFTIGIKGDPDSVYIKKKVSELNAKKEGKGDEWKKKWEITTSTFLPAFIEGYNDYIEKSGIPKIVTNENETVQPEFTMVLRLCYLYTDFDTPKLGTYLDIYSKDNKIEPIVSMLLNIIYYNNSKKYSGANAGTFFTAGRVLGKYFKSDIFQGK